MQHAYDERFKSYADQSSRNSALHITRLLAEQLPITSVLDIGCAKGTWLKAWNEVGAQQIVGVDGDYVDRAKLAIPVECFQAHDLAKPLDLKRQFDLVQSLEVAEHIDPRAAAEFIANLTRHSRGLVLFSAAPPGQGGEFHVNEQAYDYWRRHFSAHGFIAHDFIRPQIAAQRTISYWYRYNLFLYVHQDFITQLPAAVADTRVGPDQSLADLSPLLFRLRKTAVRMLPNKARDALARFKANFLPSGRW